jgi:hypothetical protein
LFRCQTPAGTSKSPGTRERELGRLVLLGVPDGWVELERLNSTSHSIHDAYGNVGSLRLILFREYTCVEETKRYMCAWLRVALHLEVGPIRCVRGLKFSLVIG